MVGVGGQKYCGDITDIIILSSHHTSNNDYNMKPIFAPTTFTPLTETNMLLPTAHSTINSIRRSVFLHL
jgi:hypothetical protein